MQALMSMFDYVPLVLMSAAALFFVVAIILLWPYLQRERHADAEETRKLRAQENATEAAREQVH